MQYIEIQHTDGRDEHIEGDNLADRWEQITDDTTGIQYAAYFVPKRNSNGHRASGMFGITRDEATAHRDASQQARRERTEQALAASYAARDWTWTSPHKDSHL